MPGKRRILLVLTMGTLSIAALSSVAAQAFVFKAPKYSILKGERSGPDHFVLAGIEDQCQATNFEGTFYSRTLEIVPVYDNCVAKAMGGLPAKFILYGCAYLVRANGRVDGGGRWTATVDLTCRTNYSLRWQVYESEEKYEEAAPLCTTLMHPQTGIGTAVLSNMAGRPSDITIHWNLNELEYEAYGSSLFCGSPENATEHGGTSYTGYSTIGSADLLEHPLNLAVGD